MRTAASAAWLTYLKVAASDDAQILAPVNRVRDQALIRAATRRQAAQSVFVMMIQVFLLPLPSRRPGLYECVGQRRAMIWPSLYFIFQPKASMTGAFSLPTVFASPVHSIKICFSMRHRQHDITPAPAEDQAACRMAVCGLGRYSRKISIGDVAGVDWTSTLRRGVSSIDGR